MSSGRVLLIGEQPPPGASTSNHSPLFPLPSGCSGHRLRVVSGLSKYEYLRAFDRLNLIPYPSEKWPRDEAVWAALSLVRGCALRDRRVVLLGTKVRDAFSVWVPSLLQSPVGEWRHHLVGGGFHLALLPHPSGRSRAWNDPGVRRKAKALLQQAAADYRVAYEDVGEVGGNYDGPRGYEAGDKVKVGEEDD